MCQVLVGSSVELRQFGKSNVFGFVCRSKQDTCHRSRERKGGGDLILVVRIFMRGVSVQSFVIFDRPQLFSVDFQERLRQTS